MCHILTWWYIVWHTCETIRDGWTKKKRTCLPLWSLSWHSQHIPIYSMVQLVALPQQSAYSPATNMAQSTYPPHIAQVVPGGYPSMPQAQGSFPAVSQLSPASRGILALPSSLLAMVAHSWLRFMCLMLLGQREVLLSACILMCLVVCSCFE